MNESVTLSTQLVNAIFSYLTTRPYAEVYQMVAELQKQATQTAPVE
jgi:hypothetical protein